MTSTTHQNTTRRFGAHLSLSWWKPITVIVLPPIAMLLLQIALFQVVALIQGSEPEAGVVTPLQLLAVNISMGVTGLLSVPLIARLAKVPWRTILSQPRSFDRRRLVGYLLWAFAFTILGNAAMAILVPDRTPWVGFGITASTIALIVIIVLTTPMQAAAEELMYRGAMMPAVASWIRPERLALGLGATVSSVVFAASHLATDPWLFGYHLFLGLATAAMAVRSRGLEAPIAFHIANNTFTALLNTVLAGGGDFSVERSAGSGGPHLFIPAIFVLATLAIVWVREARSNRNGGSHPGTGAITDPGTVAPGERTRARSS